MAVTAMPLRPMVMAAKDMAATAMPWSLWLWWKRLWRLWLCPAAYGYAGKGYGGFGYGGKGYGGYGYGAFPAGKYGYGLAAPVGFAAKPDYAAPVGASYVGAGPGLLGAAPSALGVGALGAAIAGGAGAARAANQGLRQSNAAASAHNINTAYNNDQWLSDRDTAFDRNAAAAARDQGATDWAGKAAQTANAADAASAASARTANADKGKASFDENQWNRDAASRHLSDRSKKNKVYKKWFNNKHHGGDNWERLKYDHDQKADDFGYDTASGRQWGNNANNAAWRAQDGANGRKAAAARASAAAKNAQASDWRGAANGWQKAGASAAARDAASNSGWRNSAFNRNRASNAFDTAASNARRLDRGSSRAAGDVAAAGAGAGLGGVGFTGRAYGLGGRFYGPGFGSGGYNYGYPAKGFYGAYPGYGKGAYFGGYYGGKGFPGGYVLPYRLTDMRKLPVGHMRTASFLAD